MSGTGKLLALALGLLMGFGSFPVAFSSENGGPGVASGRDALVTADTLETTVDVQKAGSYFFSIGADNRMRQMPVPAPEAGMPPEVLSAVERAPDWLREDLSEKFRELATYQVNPGPRGRLALADFDADGDLDIMAGGMNRNLTGYENLGNPLFPLLSYDREYWFNMQDGVHNQSPAAGDLNGDGYPDLAVGLDDGSIVFALNSPEGWGRLGYSSMSAVSSFAAPALGDLDSDGDPDLVVGDGAGKIQYFENTGNRTGYRFQRTPGALPFAPLAVPGPACPALADLNGDGTLDLAVGGGNGVVHYFRNIGTPSLPAWSPDDLTMFSGIQAAGQAAPSLADLNGDNRTDLLVGEGTGTVLFYENAGSSTDPAWPTWPFYSYTPQIGYYPARNYVTHVWYSAAIGYATALNTIEQRCVDELAFSIAHSAVEALRASSPELYAENARSLYENDQFLDYVQIVDYANYSTTRYTVNSSGRLGTFELPRDIYYWYVAHPKITDEIPLYIDPGEASGSPNEGRPPPAGKFWRNHLFFNADPSYPPDPATDANGDGVPDFHYPKTMGPPVLKDLLFGVTTLWNCSSYSSPAGYDNEGMNNSHPAGYGDHAIERISYWVMKTLPLNEQESADGERPVQPVRIARGHNGNCGELGDLTVAAARACLIPASEVSMLAEDHVWIEFYERGWHQWDNYWSDGGAVVDDFMNYWFGWGHRGGSGISKWRGDDYTFEVTSQYIPPAVQSHVTVNVKDPNGQPVDGARVVMMSHWMAEQQALPAGITFPFPAIWNYTDCDGTATFVLAHNNFTIDVVSKLGHAADNKTYISTGQDYVFNFTLPGRMPDHSPSYNPIPASYERELAFRLHTESGEQRPPNPEVGTTSVQPISTNLNIHALLLDEENFTRSLSGQTASGNWVFDAGDHDWAMYLGANETWYFVLWNERALETSKKVHVKLVLSVMYAIPGVSIDYPAAGVPVDSSRPVPVSGRILGAGDVQTLELSVDGGPRQNITGGLDRAAGRWRWETDLSSLPAGSHRLSVELRTPFGFANGTGVIVELDRNPPQVFIDEPASGAVFALDDLLLFSGRATDDQRMARLCFRLDGLPLTDITGRLFGDRWNFTLPGGTLGGGRHTVEVRAEDTVSRSSNATVYFELRDEGPPVVTITAPAELQAFEIGATVTLEGTARDLSRVASLELAIAGRTASILPRLDTSGNWRFSWDSLGRPDTGDLSFTVTARDDSGNRATAGRVFCLVDTQAPSVAVLAPSNGAVFIVGDVVNISGTCSDNLGVMRLEAALGPGGWKNIAGTLRDGRFRGQFDTADLSAGRYNITVRAVDSSGNAGTSMIYINVERPVRPGPARGGPGAFIPGMECWALLGAFGLLALKKRGAKEE